jgi:hypothetical protein
MFRMTRIHRASSSSRRTHHPEAIQEFTGRPKNDPFELPELNEEFEQCTAARGLSIQPPVEGALESPMRLPSWP